MDAQSHQSSRLPSLDDARNDIIASSQAHYPIASAKVHIPRLSEYTPLSPETDLDVDIPPFDFPRPSSHHASFPYSTSSTSNPSEMAATATLLQYNQYPAIHIKPRPHILPLDPASIHSIPTKKPTPLHLDSVAEEFAHPAKKRRNDNSITLIGTSADESLRYIARKLPQSSSSTSSKSSHALPRLATANSYPEEPKRTTTSNQSSSIPTPTSATIESHPSSFSQASPCSHKLKSPSLSSSSLSTLSLPQSHDNPTVPALSLQFNPSSHPILLEFFNLLQSHYSNLGSSNSRLSGADETGIWRLKQSPYPSPALSSAPSYSPLPLFTTVASSDRLSSSCSSVTSLPSLSNANYNPYFPRVNSTHLSIPLSAQAQLNYNQRTGALCKPNSVMLELPWSKKLKVMYEKDGESRIGKQFLQLQRGKCKDAVREDVIHWIMKVNDTHPHFGYHSETLHLMVSYMDHFLQSTRVARINQFYLLGITSLSLAAKMAEEFSDPLMDDMITVGKKLSDSQGQFGKKSKTTGKLGGWKGNDVKKMERRILSALSFSLNHVTPHHVIFELLKIKDFQLLLPLLFALPSSASCSFAISTSSPASVASTLHNSTFTSAAGSAAMSRSTSAASLPSVQFPPTTLNRSGTTIPNSAESYLNQLRMNGLLKSNVSSNSNLSVTSRDGLSTGSSSMSNSGCTSTVSSNGSMLRGLHSVGTGNGSGRENNLYWKLESYIDFTHSSSSLPSSSSSATVALASFTSPSSSCSSLPSTSSSSSQPLLLQKHQIQQFLSKCDSYLTPSLTSISVNEYSAFVRAIAVVNIVVADLLKSKSGTPSLSIPEGQGMIFIDLGIESEHNDQNKRHENAVKQCMKFLRDVKNGGPSCP